MSEPRTRRLFRIARTCIVTLTFSAAAILKYLSITQFRQTVYASGLLPFNLIPLVANGIIVLELAIALLIWSSFSSFVAKVSTVFCSTLFCYNVWRWFVHINAPCNCFGTIYTMPVEASLAITAALSIISASLSGNARESGKGGSQDLP